MTFEGVLTKMTTEFTSPVNYYLIFNDNFIHMNQLLDKTIRFSFVKYECLNCHLDKPIFRQGFCKSCFFDIPQAADWIMKPELSKAHLDEEERDLDYEKRVQLQPHIVYLANSSNVKVGVTRKTQVPTRWIDQGAHEALEILEAPNRYLAGITEVALKDFVADKTNWRTMLKNDIKDEDLCVWREKLIPAIPEEARDYIITNKKETEIQFPVLHYPKKPKSLNFGKTQHYEGVLKGIKGQYLIFEDDTVCNIRSNEGYVIQLTIN
ncbi:DUF2797 domain-containing protein [Aurantibacter aestuarii]|uniref:DUF2797 domain-containing protein n=1 Tax=Aurantibacter aestuarii TaxID=1266046 RepID=A0A2T1NES6_9FLAO|nr:DUF2797 domain-containing protein [Aurantibacter aestuarii]PSG90943.1 DUF2797 domain-containing protein [Aurantibacter aestuarii]